MERWHKHKPNLYKQTTCHKCKNNKEDSIHAISCQNEQKIIDFSIQTLTEEVSSRATCKQNQKMQTQWLSPIIHHKSQNDDPNGFNTRDWIRGIITKELFQKITETTGTTEFAKQAIIAATQKIWVYKFKLWKEICEEFAKWETDQNISKIEKRQTSHSPKIKKTKEQSYIAKKFEELYLPITNNWIHNYIRKETKKFEIYSCNISAKGVLTL
jgi:hypothetical protein